MKSILITGSEGQLGNSLRLESQKHDGFNCTFIDIKDLDLTNSEEVKNYFEHNRYDYIINCAAYTQVDQAEKNPETAFAVNEGIPALLAEECIRGTRLIHISTDYVYDGTKNLPHLEDENTAPESVYAKSKLAGEDALKNNPLCLIIRTSWLYSEFGNNFVNTMLRLSGQRNEINVVYDQVGTPTYAADLARVIFVILSESEQNTFKGGIYNYSNEGVCSWFDFACEIMKYTNSTCRILPIRTREYPLPAARPAFSVMDKSKIKRTFDIRIPHWRDSLYIALDNLNSNKL